MLNWPGSVPRDPHVFSHLPMRIDLHDARVVVAVGDEDVAGVVPGHVGRPVEPAPRHRGGGPAGARFHRLVAPAEHHQDLPGRAELDDHVRPFVRRPDVVVLVDANGMRERKTVEVLADLPDECAVAA